MRKDKITPTCRLCGKPDPRLENGLCAECSPAGQAGTSVGQWPGRGAGGPACLGPGHGAGRRAGRDGTVWLTSTQTATMLGITRQTLLDWWTKWKKGPPFIRPGVRGDRRYRLEDAEAFLRVNH